MNNWRTRPAVFAIIAIYATAAWLMPGVAEAADPSHRVARLKALLNDSTSTHVMVVAHRGDWHSAPENSLAGIQSCIDMGVDVVELDVRRTADGRFVLIHDKTLERTTNGTGRVADHTLEQLKTLRLKRDSGELTDQQIPTLEEALALCRGKILVYLDKTEDEIDQVHAAVEAAGMADGVMYYGRLDQPALRARYGALLDRICYLPKVGDATPDVKAYLRGFADMRPPAFIIDFAADDAAVVREIPAIRSSGARVWASPLWDTLAGGRTDTLALTDPHANWGWLLDRGVTMLCTDRPRELIAYLQSRGLRQE